MKTSEKFMFFGNIFWLFRLIPCSFTAIFAGRKVFLLNIAVNLTRMLKVNQAYNRVASTIFVEATLKNRCYEGKNRQNKYDGTELFGLSKIIHLYVAWF